MAWYLPAYGTNGNFYLRGPYESSYQCEMKGTELEHPGEPIEYPTTNLARATQIWKEGRVGKDGLDKATKRIRH